MGAKRILVFIDGFCPHCRATGIWIQRLDLLGRFRVISFRHDQRYRAFSISEVALEQAMHVVLITVTTAPKVAVGYEAVRMILQHMPLLWPLRPFAWVLSKLGLGERLYRWLALRRLVVFDGTNCHGDACSIVRRE